MEKIHHAAPSGVHGVRARLCALSVAAILILVSGAASAQPDGLKWFLANQTYHLHVERATLGLSDTDGIATDMQEQGHEVDSVRTGSAARGWIVTTQMQLDPRWGVEAGGAQLTAGGVSLEGRSDEPEVLLEDLVEQVPVAASGPLIGVTWRASLADAFGLTAPFAHQIRLETRAGLMFWSGSVRLSWEGEEAQHNLSGTDPYVVLGVSYQLSRNFDVALSWRHMETDWEQSGPGLSAAWQFW